MKRLTYIALVLTVVWGGRAAQAAFPKPVGYVNDFAGIIPQDVAQKLNGLLQELEEKTTAEVAVVTIADLEGEDIEGYAVDLFENWGLGQRGKDNGILILAAMAQREIRIEVGYGLEGILPDGLVGEIIRQQITPAFKTGDYGRGLLAGTVAVVNIIAKDAGVQLEGLRGINHKQYPASTPRKRLGGFLSLILFFLLFLLFLRYPRLFALLLLSNILGGGRRGGYWSGGGFSGGFGGFGGGLSGGGGASGSW
jgi:uncharacterized protein